MTIIIDQNDVFYIMVGVVIAIIMGTGIVMTLLASTKDREETAVDVQRNLARNSNAFRKGYRR